MKTTTSKGRFLALMWVGALLTVACGTGCQVSVGGQTLPSPWYTTDDVQYYAPGPEFKLSREAAAMKSIQVEQELLGR